MDCIITDPPYYRVASELYKKPGCEWDDQWPDMQHYLRWMGELIGECFRVLKDNGSLYIFADTLMAWRISQLTEEAGFIQLNDLVWKKNNALPMKFWRNIRTYATATEHCIFCEKKDIRSQTGLQQIMCNPDCFKPVREWLCSERDRLMADKALDMTGFRRYFGGLTGTDRMEYHYFGSYQWCIPTPDIFAKMQSSGYWLTDPGDILGRHSPRASYEDLRRPFHAAEDFTDVWSSNITVSIEDVFHPTQKPIAIIQRMVETSTDPGDLVLDPFMGSGTTAAACIRTGRHYLGWEQDSGYYEQMQERLKTETYRKKAITTLDGY